jgi:hypothetical protein
MSVPGLTSPVECLIRIRESELDIKPFACFENRLTIFMPLGAPWDMTLIPEFQKAIPSPTYAPLKINPYTVCTGSR